MDKKVWLITGAGSGIGYALCNHILAQGDCVVALTRNKEKLSAKLDSNNGNLLILEVDLKSKESMKMAVDKTKETFQTINVLVNNAGYELAGYIEEVKMEEIKDVFEINFFAPLQLTQMILPIMREQKNGYIINMASKAGTLYSYTGSVTYNTSKAALDSFSKTLSSEVQCFGINVSSLIMGQFKTELFDNLKWTEGSIDVYKEEKEVKKENIQKMNHNQKGNVECLCRLIYEMSCMKNPPREVFIGEDAYELAYGKSINILNKLSTWEKKCRYMST